VTRHLATVLATAALCGCSTFAAQRYSISADNVTTLRSISGNSLKVGPFTAFQPGLSEILCRAAGPVTTQDGEPFSDFVRKALIDELKIANVYSETAAVTLSGHLNEIDFSSMSGAWHISLAVKSSNGKSIAITERYAFRSSFRALTACGQTAQALTPAVQNLIGKLVVSPEFHALAQ
jgi:hypothetical protein